MFLLELGRLAESSRDIGDHLRLNPPNHGQIGQNRQDAQRSRRQGQRTRKCRGSERRVHDDRARPFAR